MVSSAGVQKNGGCFCSSFGCPMFGWVDLGIQRRTGHVEVQHPHLKPNKSTPHRKTEAQIQPAWSATPFASPQLPSGRRFSRPRIRIPPARRRRGADPHGSPALPGRLTRSLHLDCYWVGFLDSLDFDLLVEIFRFFHFHKSLFSAQGSIATKSWIPKRPHASGIPARSPVEG